MSAPKWLSFLSHTILIGLILKSINKSFIFGIFLSGIGLLYLIISERKTTVQRPKPKLLNIQPGKPHKIDISSLNEPLFPQSKRISEELDQIVKLVTNDFILSWFQRIDNNLESEFPDNIRLILRNIILKLQNNFMHNDMTSIVAFKLIPLITKHINAYCSARATVLSSNRNRSSNSDNFNLRTAIEFNNIYRLHKAISLKPDHLDTDIESYMENKAEKLTKILLNKKELRSNIVIILCREILSKNILLPLIVKFYDPDKLNCLIISISKKIINERNQIQEVKSILTRELQDKNTNNQNFTNMKDLLGFNFTLRDDITTEEFESYLRGLSGIVSISDLKTGKFLLTTTLLKVDENKSLNNKKKNAYKNKISLSLGLIENRLRTLSQNSIEMNRMKNKSQQEITPSNDVLNKDNVVLGFENIIQKITFESIINDELCLSYFEEFLKIAYNTRGLVLLNYWKSVESYKNPLEDAGREDILLEVSQLDINNIKLIAKEYLEGEQLDSLKSLDEGLVSNINLFTMNDLDVLGKNGYLLARKSMLLLQSAAENILENEYLKNFKKSSIFLKMISSPEFINTDTYSKYFVPKIENNAKHSIVPVNKKIAASAVDVLSDSGLNDAIEDIIRSEDITTIQHETSNKNNNSILNSSLNRRDGLDSDMNMQDMMFKDDLFSFNTSPAKGSQTLPKSNEMNDGQSNIDDAEHENNSNSRNKIIYSEPSDLKSKIGDLTLETNQLQQELDLLNHLILKAKLTNNKSQLNILISSQKALTKEKKIKELLKQQYMVEENTTSLYQKTRVAIRSYILDYEMSNLKEVAYYIINVVHSNGETATSWEIPRRYTEFTKLNSYLKKKYKPAMKNIIKKEIFPTKMAMSLKYQMSQTLLFEKRRKQFQLYLTELLQLQEICRDNLFRKFLTTTKPFSVSNDTDTPSTHPRKIMNSNSLEIATKSNNNNGSEDTGANIGHGSECSSSSNSLSPTPKVESVSIINNNDLNDLQEDKLTMSTLSEQNSSHNYILQDTSTLNKMSFIKPICDLFIAIFSSYPSENINSGTGRDYWLRGGAIIMLLQQLFGSTIEKYIRDTIAKVSSEPKLYDILFQSRIRLWGVGGYFEIRQKTKLNPPPVRSEVEKKRAYNDSQLLFQALLVELSGKVVGLHHAREAAAKIHDIVQNPYMNASILLEIFDLLLDDIVFEENPLKI